MGKLPSLSERGKEYYALDLASNLPPGTDSPDQLNTNRRQPRPPAEPKRPLPEWPPEAERKGKWISAYLDKLDPETEYDQIIKTATFFTGNSFAIALGYTSTLLHLAQTPAGAAATHHGGKIFRRGHQRFYETQDFILDCMWHGSSSAAARSRAGTVNRIHARIWRDVPGAYSSPFEGEMSLIGSAFFETMLRKLVGARRADPHPVLAAAWPAWAERVLAHFRTEPADGGGSFAVNFPRDFDELERFYRWFQNLPMDRFTNDEDRRKGHELAEAFTRQFCELWFPRQLHWLGRLVLLTIVPRQVREQQQLGHPNRFGAALVRLFFKIQIDLADALPDPVRPSFYDDYMACKGWGWSKIDANVVRVQKRSAQKLNVLLVVLLVIVGAGLFWRSSKGL
ncbi:hypothetical protein C8035_v010995 [Colletotrichum spinosum]|uniref:ER-bound oxygenase mpaB/mpaB'/Rubber oxygenase catalytic domain-containing protein n=1 Tax=Colletotrichum spinosum TaxID=1347390 RepID=A0A4R8Q3M1_9PEZI|nr:hypothetical protein C8035_v010995 [Colletotrichum spinosum]